MRGMNVALAEATIRRAQAQGHVLAKRESTRYQCTECERVGHLDKFEQKGLFVPCPGKAEAVS